VLSLFLCKLICEIARVKHCVDNGSDYFQSEISECIIDILSCLGGLCDSSAQYSVISNSRAYTFDHTTE